MFPITVIRFFTLTAFGLLLLGADLYAQAHTTLPEFEMDRVDVETHVRVLASDAMMGRMTGTPGNDQAASYIAANFEAFGLDPVPGQESYFQYLHFEKLSPAANGSLVLGGDSFTAGEDLVLMRGARNELSLPVIFAGHGWVDEEQAYNDYADIDPRGKIVVVLPGTPDGTDARGALRLMAGGKKLKEAHKRGAAGLIELARFRMGWPMFRQYISRPQTNLAADGEPLPQDFIYGWLHEGESDVTAFLRNNPAAKAELTSSGAKRESMRSQNVAAFLPGIDPDLGEEVVLLPAHYDHVGVNSSAPGGEGGERDSIFNGARDNALGVAALLATARSLADRPPRRSVLFLALTAEEMGMIGSSYYAEHPLYPIGQTVFNINCDGAGYNDTSKASVIGVGRTNMDDHLEEGLRPFGLEMLKNPMPEQNLYERSDNISFARKGVPAVTVSPGITEFDAYIRTYYHQPADEADGMDFGYVLQFCQSFAHMSRIVADAPERPAWMPGQEF